MTPLSPAQLVPEKKQRLVDAAVALLLRKGYAGTSVDEICQAAGVTKGSFFHYFANKEEIAKAAMDVWSGNWRAILEAGKFAEIPDALDRLRHLFRVMEAAYLGSPLGPGCVVGTVAQETGASLRSLGDPSEAHLDDWKAGVARIVDEAKAAHPPQTPFDTDTLVEFMLAVVQGTMLVGKTRQRTDTIPRILFHCRCYVLGLFGAEG